MLTNQPILIPDFSLVVLIGASGSGKSTFGRKHFLPTEILSSDAMRGWVSDDETSQDATSDAFDVLHYLAAKRLARMKLTVIDATNVQRDARKPLIDLARKYHALPVAIVLDIPDRVCISRNATRADRAFGAHVIHRQRKDLKASLRGLEREGFRRVFVLTSEEEANAVMVSREPLWNDRKSEHGPFDIIGDVHGCYDELVMLLATLGYAVDAGAFRAEPPAGRKAIFLGDLVDRGPKSSQVLKLVMNMIESGAALAIPGNHDEKLLKKLRGRDVKLTHGLAATMDQLDAEPDADAFKRKVKDFLDSLVSHYVLDGGELVVAHAGMKEEMAGRASGAVREFALYGETTGEIDDLGLPVRYNWAADYRGRAMVIYGHTPVPHPEWLNRTLNIDTGCVFGGKLTALRYPEQEIVSVPALKQYYEPARPFLPSADAAPALSVQQSQDDVIDIADLLPMDSGTGARYIETRLMSRIRIRRENAAAALEVMSRFAINPKWLIYLPPTMSPTATSTLPDLLEHPVEAFGYYRDMGVNQVICQMKHMGSRAVAVVCRDEDAARSRFGVVGEGIGAIFTRTGRAFFNDEALEQAMLVRVHDAASSAGLWESLDTDWLLLDCELLPWSAKAQELLKGQYAAVGAAATLSLSKSLQILEAASVNGLDVAALHDRYRSRADSIALYRDAYRGYCWDVNGLDDLRLAPFHLLASENAVHIDKPHTWHMETLASLCAADPDLLLATEWIAVDTTDDTSIAAGVEWWNALTSRGGEGMVVKPLDFLVTGERGIIQPAVKVRGREYLRIIYGAEYTLPKQIDRLRQRGLSGKRGLALRELSLGIEAMERFVRHEPLRRIHECVFGVLALESEPVDPRL